MLKAQIISQGLTITHAQGIRDRVGEIYGDEFIAFWFLYDEDISVFLWTCVCAHLGLYIEKKKRVSGADNNNAD